MAACNALARFNRRCHAGLMSLHAAYASKRDRILTGVHASSHQRSGYSDTLKAGQATIIDKPDMKASIRSVYTPHMQSHSCGVRDRRKICALLEDQRCMTGISRTRHAVRRLYVPVPSANLVQSGRCADQTP